MGEFVEQLTSPTYDRIVDILTAMGENNSVIQTDLGIIKTYLDTIADLSQQLAVIPDIVTAVNTLTNAVTAFIDGNTMSGVLAGISDINTSVGVVGTNTDSLSAAELPLPVEQV